jgi:hypothetical protein
MRGLKRLHSAQVVGSGHALVQNIRRGHTNWASTSNHVSG